jgi:hypothetical protein
MSQSACLASAARLVTDVRLSLCREQLTAALPVMKAQHVTTCIVMSEEALECFGAEAKLKEAEAAGALQAAQQKAPYAGAPPQKEGAP